LKNEEGNNFIAVIQDYLFHPLAQNECHVVKQQGPKNAVCLSLKLNI
jgi:hypothetical protein